MAIHRLVVDHVDHTETYQYRVTFRCTCGEYTGEETATTQDDALALAANKIRIHEASATGTPTVEIRF